MAVLWPILQETSESEGCQPLAGERRCELRRIIGPMVVVALAAAAALGVSGAQADPGQGEGHTPVVVCHWVPAHGGSFVVITVDDDGAKGNKNLEAHAGHENDIIAPEDGVCPGDVGDVD
jgi:hypothetical protein